MEVLRTLAAATPACMRALLQSNCVDTCLTVLDRADSNSNSKVARTAALLLHDALDWDSVCRCSNRKRKIKNLYIQKVLYVLVGCFLRAGFGKYMAPSQAGFQQCLE